MTFCVNDVFSGMTLVKDQSFDETRSTFLDCDISLVAPILVALDTASTTCQGQLVFLRNKSLIQIEVNNA